ncbi:MAG: hypothetical protein DLM64_14030 [Solirubrobacterales bacterium]|nr:MAG: hypothetical protein DLM64_14030 [Solirubrobacterales bacterium]
MSEFWDAFRNVGEGGRSGGGGDKQRRDAERQRRRSHALAELPKRRAEWRETRSVRTATGCLLMALRAGLTFATIAWSWRTARSIAALLSISKQARAARQRAHEDHARALGTGRTGAWEALTAPDWRVPAAAGACLLVAAFVPVAFLAGAAFVACAVLAAVHGRRVIDGSVAPPSESPTPAALGAASAWSYLAFALLLVALVVGPLHGGVVAGLIAASLVVLIVERRRRRGHRDRAVRTIAGHELTVLADARSALGMAELAPTDERDDLSAHVYGYDEDGAPTAAAIHVPSWRVLRQGDREKVAEEFARHAWDVREFDHHTGLIGLSRTVPPEPLPSRVDIDLRRLPSGRVFLLGRMRGEDGGLAWSVWDPDAADPHLLMVGRTKTGKSVVLTVLLAQAVARGWRTYVLDPKGSDYVWTRNLPLTSWHPVERSQEGLEAAFREMERRRAVLEAIQVEHDEVRNFTEAIEAGLIDPADEPPCLVLIDEMAELVELGDKASNKAATTMLGRLARLARFVDIFLVVATQRPDATLLPGEVKSNLGTRGVTGKGDSIGLRMAFDDDEVAPLTVDPDTGKLPKGRGRIMVGADAPVEVQFAYVSPADVKAVAGVADDPEPVPSAEHESPSPEPSAPAPEQDPTLAEMFSELDRHLAHPSEGGGIEVSLDDDEPEAGS